MDKTNTSSLVSTVQAAPGGMGDLIVTNYLNVVTSPSLYAHHAPSSNGGCRITCSVTKLKSSVNNSLFFLPSLLSGCGGTGDSQSG